MYALAALIAMAGAAVLPGHARAASEPAAAEQGGAATTVRLAFNLPGQPLAAALRRFGEITGKSILYETRWTVGKQSAALHGDYRPDEALSLLLQGTGLAARVLSDEAVSVAPPGTQASTPDRAAPKAAAKPADRRTRLAQHYYEGYLQQRIAQSLCALPAWRADMQRVVLRFSIDTRRRIDALRVRVAGAPALEPAVRQALSRLAIEPPPPGLAQPVLMLILPESVEESCRS